MGRINILDSVVFNQISAGEVVENPSSVVKELVENSIDAGADNITIMIEDGGIKTISVIDNGCGIEKDDLSKTILPHATSKITSAKDLLSIGTLGFRGEALASIAAVSEVIIKSKYIESDLAYEVIVKGGDITLEGVTNLSVGTSITVNNIFFNTPARYKFLKTKKGEETLITKLIQDLIFSNPDVAFKYFIDNELIYQTNGDGLTNAIYAVYSSDIADNMIPFSLSERNHTISGFTARPTTNAIYSNKSRQNIIVNGRIIEDNTLSIIIQKAYGESLMKRTFPTIILDIVMPFELVDVNVHPSKKEVRFANSKTIYGIVHNAIKNALELDAETRQAKLFESVYNLAESNETENETSSNDSHYKLVNNNPFNYKYSSDIEIATYNYSAPAKRNDDNAINFNEVINMEEKIDSVQEFFSKKQDISKKEIKYSIIGQLFETYILIQYCEKFLIIDQHAAHERMLYDKLIAQNDQDIVAQELLFPYTANMPEDKMIFIQENLSILKSLGFDVSLKNNTIRLSAIPYMLTNIDLDGFLAELIDETQSFDKITDADKIKEKIAQTACKKAIKSGDKLNETQLNYVINYFFENGMPLQCPHGRPTTIVFTKSEIEKLFRRIV